jgi:hypothetical protein
MPCVGELDAAGWRDSADGNEKKPPREISHDGFSMDGWSTAWGT